jgi:hypothetical protein
MKSFRSSLRIAAAVLSVFALVFVVGCGSDSKTTEPTNRAPVINQVTVTPSTINAGQSATVTVIAQDPDGDAMTYQFQGPGTILPNLAMATWTPPSVAGSHTISVTARDPDGAVSAAGLGYVTVTAVQQQTGIRGTITAPPGVQVDLRNMLVRVYSSYGDYLADAPATFAAAQGTEYSITFTFPNLPPGSTYYVDAWKDMDGSASYTVGDVWSVYATGAWPNQTVAPVIVTNGNMTDISSGMVTFLL